MSGLTLLAPLGLLGLLGIPLVVLFHMRNTTPHTIPTPTLRFWRQAQELQSETVRFRRPPLTLLLLLHLALVAVIALSLARPVASEALGGLGGRTTPTHLVLLLDGSTSMAAAVDPLGPAGRTRFDLARDAALDELRELREGDVATILILGTRTTTLEATDAAGIQALRERLASLPLPGGRADLNAALRLCQDLLLPGMTDQIVLVSDGADGADPALVERIGAPIRLRAISGDIPPDNLAITDLVARGAPDRPGQQQIYTRVVNFGPQAMTVPVAVEADGIPVATRDVIVDPDGGAAELVEDVPAGAAAVTVSIRTADAFRSDDSASLLLGQEGAAGLRVLLVSDAATALRRALAVLPGAQVTSMTLANLTAGGLPGPTDLIVFEGSTPTGAFPDVPALVVNPLSGAFPSTGVIADPEAIRIKAQDPLLRGVDLAGVVFGQIPALALATGDVEVVGAEGGPLIYRSATPGSGQPMVVMAFDLTQTNLPRRVSFPILVANAAGELAPSALPPASPLGDPLTYAPRAGTATVRVTAPNGDAVDLTVPPVSATNPEAVRTVTFADTGQPGEYAVAELAEGGAELSVSRLVINAGHPQESDLRPNLALPDTLRAATATGDTGGGTSRDDLWPLLVLVAIALLSAEWLVSLWPSRRRRALSGRAAPARPGLGPSMGASPR